MEELKKDYPGDLDGTKSTAEIFINGYCTGQAIDVTFNRINQKVREIGFEIRTVIALDDEGKRTNFHGLANTVFVACFCDRF